MVAWLTGKVKNIELAHSILVLDVNGVGYEVFCSQEVLAEAQEGQAREFFIYTHVREDTLQLFGFCNTLDKQVFLSLISVNGIGPKLALNLLSATSVQRLVHWIENQDTKSLTQLPKVGRKTAEQMILSLRGKLPQSSEPGFVEPLESRQEIVSALVNLGYKKADVEEAVEQMKPDSSVTDGIRQGLSLLSEHGDR